MSTNRYVRAFRAHSSPRFLPEDVGSPSAQNAADLIRSASIRGHSQPAVAENAVLQSSLWGAVRSALTRKLCRMVELRWVVHEAGVIDPWILISGDEEAATRGWLRTLEGVLPRDFQWAPADVAANSPLAGTGPLPLTSRGEYAERCFVARVIRRRMAIHLPRYTAQVMRSLPRDTSGSAVSAFAQQYFDLPHIPGPMTVLPVATDLGAFDRGLALPVVIPVSEALPDRRRLCAEAISGAPLIISLQAWPITPSSLSHDRWRSDFMRRCWDALSEPVKNAVNANYGFPVRETWDRYLRAPQDVMAVEMRVFAATPERASKTATMLANQYGGLHCFEVLVNPDPGPVTALRDRSDFDAAHDDSADARDQRMRHDRETWARREGVRHETVGAQQDDDGGFVYGLRDLYSAQEADSLLRLPFAYKAGLPGVQTHLVPPFHTLPKTRMRVRDPDSLAMLTAPSDRLRLGVPYAVESILQNTPDDRARVARGALAPIAEATGPRDSVWHSMDIRNLTKHGLIVGSTGSGKTVTTTFLVLEAVRNGIDVLVVEPIKAEYFDKFDPLSQESQEVARAAKKPWRHPKEQLGYELQRFYFEADKSNPRPGDDHLRFDPMRVQPHITLARHISYLKSCFESAFMMQDWMAVRIENALHEYYYRAWPKNGGCGMPSLYARGGSKSVGIGPRIGDLTDEKIDGKVVTKHPYSRQLGVYPSLETFCDFVLKYFLPRWKRELQGSSRSAELLEPFVARFQRLQNGPIGQAAKLADQSLLEHEFTVSHLKDGLILRGADGVLQTSTELANRIMITDGTPEERAKSRIAVPDDVPESAWNPFASVVPDRRARGGTLEAAGRTGSIRIVELEALSDGADKALVMAFLLTFLYERRQAEDLDFRGRAAPNYYLPPPARPKHLLVLEEAHRVLSASASSQSAGEDVAGQSAGAKTAEMFTDMLAEIRALGQSIFIVEQIPTKLAPDAIKNTNLKLMHRITSQPDREFLGSAMNFTDMQKEFVSTLRPGQAVAFEENEDQPILLNMPGSAEWTEIFGARTGDNPA